MTHEMENQIVYGLIMIMFMPVLLLAGLIVLSLFSVPSNSTPQAQTTFENRLPLSEGTSIQIESTPLQATPQSPHQTQQNIQSSQGSNLQGSSPQLQ